MRSSNTSHVTFGDSEETSGVTAARGLGFEYYDPNRAFANPPSTSANRDLRYVYGTTAHELFRPVQRHGNVSSEASTSSEEFVTADLGLPHPAPSPLEVSTSSGVYISRTVMALSHAIAAHRVPQWSKPVCRAFDGTNPLSRGPTPTQHQRISLTE